MNHKTEEVRLNIGCSMHPLKDYVNIDLSDLKDLEKRYPNQKIPTDIKIYNYDICNLPFENESVLEVRADALLEHISFLDEKKFLCEVQRVLKPNGMFLFSVQDFEQTAKKWLSAKDEWREFYRNDKEAIEKNHWFGQYSYSMESRWGYLTAMIFGNQNGVGQFHKNCYTLGKIKALMLRLNFEIQELKQGFWKGNRDPMIFCKAVKK